MTYFEDDTPPESKENYPIEVDAAFTPDQIDEINVYKARVQKSIDKNDSILRGLETFFWSITSYSLCRYTVLTLGLSGINLAIALALIINQIVNRDCLDSFNLNRKDGQWEITGMGKLLKFGFGLLTGTFIIWNAIGEVIEFQNRSNVTYSYITEAVDSYHTLPQEEKKEITNTVVLGILGLSGLYLIVNKKK